MLQPKSSKKLCSIDYWMTLTQPGCYSSLKVGCAAINNQQHKVKTMTRERSKERTWPVLTKYVYSTYME